MGFKTEKNWNDTIDWEDIWSFAAAKMNKGGSIIVYRNLMKLHIPAAPDSYTRIEHSIDIIEFKAANEE